MLDLKFIRENIDQVRQGVENRQDTAPLDEILDLDSEHRQKVLELESLRHQRKQAARQIKADKETIEEGRDLRAMIKGLEEEVRSLDNQLEELLLQVPNVPHPTVPVGTDESDSVVVRSWGEPKSFDFTPTPHWKLGESLGIIDFERGVKSHHLLHA
jgi:seryl-tRNA synthetase